MMSRRGSKGERFIYGFSLEERVPADHLLRKIAAAIDFSFIYELVADHYSHTGAPSVDPIVVFKLSLIGYLYNIPSERRLLAEASLNMAYLWFLGYDIDEALPDHSIMTKARVRFGPDAYRTFFHRTVDACAKAGLIEGESAFCDSTLIDSIHRLEGVRSKPLLDQLDEGAAQFVDTLFEQDSAAGREQVASAGRPPASGPPVKANERFAHPLDPEADIIRHSASAEPRLAYKGHFAVDGGSARIITAVAATGGARADEHLLLGLLAEHEHLVGRPREIVADGKYATATNYRILKVKGITPVIPPRAGPGSRSGLGRENFDYDKARDSFICPTGHILARSSDLRGTKTYRSRKADCAGCELKGACLSESGKRKTVIRAPSEQIFSWARRMLESPRAAELRRRRGSWSETAFAEAKSFHGMGKARFRGRWKVEIQVLMTAAAMNLERLGRSGPKKSKLGSSLALAVGPRFLLRPQPAI